MAAQGRVAKIDPIYEQPAASGAQSPEALAGEEDDAGGGEPGSSGEVRERSVIAVAWRARSSGRSRALIDLH